MNIEILLGKTLSDIIKSEEVIIFIVSGDEKYMMYHRQDCCERVFIEDIEGDLNDIIGSPILQATESTNSEDRNLGRIKPSYCFTWTFYKIATVKGYVTIRWLGESNGYYSESVDFKKL